MSDLENESIDMILTSPPYYLKRNYGNKNQIGLENTVDKYIVNLMKVFNECYRVLSNKGSCWVVIGDSYIDGSLSSIPHRFAIEMMNCGWIQRNCIIWHKTNPKPESVKTRLGTSNEFIFFFTKIKQNYFFDPDSIRIPYKQNNPTRIKSPRHHNIKEGFQKHTSIFQDIRGKIPLDFIQQSKHSKSIGEKNGILDLEHIAVYPEDLCYLPIKSGSKKGDTILDPFSGSGTTGVVSLKLFRKYIGYEINRNFVNLSIERINNVIKKHKTIV
jgi:DNA modification methylase